MKWKISQGKKCVNKNVSSIQGKSREIERKRDCSKNFKEVSTKSKITGWKDKEKKYFFNKF